MSDYEGKCLGKVRMKWKTCPHGRTNCTNCERHVEVRTCDICGDKANHAAFYRDTGEPIKIYCMNCFIPVKEKFDFLKDYQRREIYDNESLERKKI